MKRMLIAAGLASVAATALLVAPASQAGSNLCTGTSVCIYSDQDWVGLLGRRELTSGYQNVSSGAADKTSSTENERIVDAAWRASIDGGGNCTNMPKQTEERRLVFYNDTLSSWKTNGAC